MENMNVLSKQPVQILINSLLVVCQKKMLAARYPRIKPELFEKAYGPALAKKKDSDCSVRVSKSKVHLIRYSRSGLGKNKKRRTGSVNSKKRIGMTRKEPYTYKD